VPLWICETCGIQHAETDQPPEGCAICEDARQYVGWEGQRWTTLEDLRGRHRADLREEEQGLLGIGCDPPFAIGQRALLVERVLWDCVPLLDGMAEAVEARGGLRAIAISHPHYYTTMVDWSRALGGVPVFVHADDREWVLRPDPCVELWEGEELELGDGLTLLRLGGHFAGGQVLHWAGGCGGRGALLSGDIVQVVQDRRWVGFMYSYPNLIPLPAATVRRMVEKLEPYAFERVYGAWFGRVVAEGGKERVRESAERYVQALQSSPSQ
jgi:glyoxylase-like metal-dependent hydrolase (beta-lactamase superfamily II)